MRVINLIRQTLLAGVACVLLAGTAQAAGPHWIIIGDSWGDFISDVQEQKLASLGITNFTNRAVGGTTAQQWASDANGLLTGTVAQLAALPANEPAIVYVSIGGNDILGEWTTQGASLFPRIAADIAAVRQALLAAKPNTLVLLASYDVLNFESSALCEITGMVAFGSTDPMFVNSVLLAGSNLVDQISAALPRTLSMTVIGALQGSPGMPNLGSWSPAELILPDCIHLTTEGYTVFNDAMFNKLFDMLGSRRLDLLVVD